MKILLVTTTLCLILVAPVRSLQCYSTNLAALEAQRIDSKPVTKDCSDYLAELAYRQGEFLLPFDHAELRCFTVKIDTDSANIAIQGCTTRNSCGAMVNQIKANTSKLIGEDFRLNNIACNECEEALCNGGIARTVVIKSWFFYVRKKYIVITAATFIVFMTFWILLKVFLRKYRASGADKTYSLMKV
ncbi:uncharacterized protein LOC135136983 [Zophobas morio]|uniref:uncharacterized protein LOC135136983 n=1 Tax=Zophobas morio TaxID=2755281 RepID=UPI003083792A